MTLPGLELRHCRQSLYLLRCRGSFVNMVDKCSVGGMYDDSLGVTIEETENYKSVRSLVRID
jgi:hypothetical protein